MQNLGDFSNHVGPVLQTGTCAIAIVKAIEEMNEQVVVLNRGAYLRVLVPWHCVVGVEEIEKYLGGEFRLPSDLEKIMPSFKGTLLLTAQKAIWKYKLEETVKG